MESKPACLWKASSFTNWMEKPFQPQLPARPAPICGSARDAPEHLFLVERGKIKMTVVTPEGSQLTLRFMTAGDIIGCAAVFRGIVYPATATAVEDTRLLCWTAGQITDPRLSPVGLQCARYRWWPGGGIPAAPMGRNHRKGRTAHRTRFCALQRGSGNQATVLNASWCPVRNWPKLQARAFTRSAVR